MSKCYQFTIEQECIGKGYVYADSEEEARMKINVGDYDDIYDTVDTTNGDIIEIWES
jgi:hypothetical protein